MKLSNIASGCLLALASTMSTMVFAQNEVELAQAVKTGTQINESAKTSQQRLDGLHKGTLSKLQQFKTVNKEIDGLEVYNHQMRKQITNQLTQMDEINLSIDQVSVIERQVMPLMIRMVDTLEQFIALDVPFLPKEREDRIVDLKDMLDRADVETSEKFRRILEAYQVEVQFGRDIEAYTGLLAVNGAERDVDFLRIGRVALIYQTRDGQTQGAWDQQSRQWQPLDEGYRTHINKGLRIARKQLAPDLLTVPISAVQ
jgi:uncharacterized protein (DUF885 family)